MKLLLFVWTLSAYAAVQTCMYNTDCPTNTHCEVDISGRGICTNETAEAGSNMAGQRGQSCNFPSDCNPGLVCTRPHGYLDFGVCEIEVKK